MNRKSFFCIGSLLLVGLVNIGAPVSVAGQTTSTKKTTTAAAKRPAARRTPARPTRRVSSAARARAAAMARELADTVVPRYRVDASGELVPDLHAAAAIIYSPETGEVLWEENSQTQRSIASITKIMTAVVFLEGNPNLSEQVTILPSDVRAASTTFLRSRDRLTTDDLLHLLLIASDNAAARALARVSPYGSVGFIQRMNEKAAELGLESTRYADPSGLLSDNVSSAYDMARLISHASGNQTISPIMRTEEYTVQAATRKITFHSTNRTLLARTDLDVLAGKTGFISQAGYCLATILRLPQSGEQVAVVVLGARSNAGRFLEVQNLFNWVSAKTSTIFATQAAGVGQN